MVKTELMAEVWRLRDISKMQDRITRVMKQQGFEATQYTALSRKIAIDLVEHPVKLRSQE